MSSTTCDRKAGHKLGEVTGVQWNLKDYREVIAMPSVVTGVS